MAPGLVLLALGLLAGCGGPPEPEALVVAPVSAPPTLLLITLDTTRADALGSYGGPAGDTPHLDGLAASGVRFTQAFTHAPSTQSAHATLFTGLDPHGHGVPFNGRPLAAAHETLAERLGAAGWQTLGVVGASVLGRNLGLDQGFAVYDDQLTSPGPQDRADAVTARALAAVDARTGEAPLMLWVHYFDPHHPYTTGADSDGASVDVMRGALSVQGLDDDDVARVRRLYQAEVRAMDAGIGALVAGLEARGLLAEGLIVVAGDHGEGFGEVPDRPFLHGDDVEPFATRVPLLVHLLGPRSVSPAVLDTPVALSDVGATTLGLLGLEPRLGAGRDLATLWTGGTLPSAPIFLEATKPRREHVTGPWNNLGNEHGVIWGDLLLMERVEHDQGPALWSLGPPLAPEADPDAHARLLAALRAWDAAAPSADSGQVPDTVRPALEALGYLEPEHP